jgi:hypothetical protein
MPLIYSTHFLTIKKVKILSICCKINYLPRYLIDLNHLMVKKKYFVEDTILN